MTTLNLTVLDLGPSTTDLAKTVQSAAIAASKTLHVDDTDNFRFDCFRFRSL